MRVLSPSPPVPEPVKKRTETKPQGTGTDTSFVTVPVLCRVQRTPPAVFETETYYSTIIENNLFRPLGWTPPRLVKPYRLLDTISHCRANTPPKAIIQSTTGNQTYIVSTGEKLDASTEVVSIESKQVTLSRNGQQRTLHLSIGF
ncbi:hypothetical protein F4009_11595 [Candidatus Poribacteria bacterium]|nr:hypothetical protein [Candidatus Poribacteria bacterium]MYH80004.1 hypothetical protein [Candidatus Poribacteria bacterium]MYK94616.1 hypothetical protein [Candidatus Poribacteria bacterium]